MAKNQIYRTYLNRVINPQYGMSFTLPYLEGTLRVALLTPTKLPVEGTNYVEIEGVIEPSLTFSMVNLIPGVGEQTYASWLNVTGVARYVRVYIPEDTDGLNPFIMDIDMEEDIYLENDSFTAVIGQGFLTFSGNFI